MKDLVLYWSNICILKRFENDLIEEAKTELKNYDINLIVRFFGIGHDYHMAEYMRIDSTIPDVIVSTDLEVFENPIIWNRIEPELEIVNTLYPHKNSLPPYLNWSPKLLTYLVIPLVFSYNKMDFFTEREASLNYIVKNNISLAYGGINNSGAKCIIKLVQDKYGEKVARNFIKNSTITNMPIEAFHKTRTLEVPVSLVPAIYALRADNENLFIEYPKDGAAALPSYIAVKKGALPIAKPLLDFLMNKKILNVYVNSGILYSPIEGVEDHSYLKDNNFRFQSVNPNWLWTKEAEQFYNIYKELVEKNK